MSTEVTTLNEVGTCVVAPRPCLKKLRVIAAAQLQRAETQIITERFKAGTVSA